LLIKKNRKESFGFEKLNGIGGHIEKGEEPFESAKREVKEETGLSIKTLYLVAMIFIEIRTDPGILLFVFKTKCSGGKLVPSEEGELEWWKRSSIESLNIIVKDIPFLLMLCKNFKIGDPPKIGKYLYDKNDELRIVMNS